MLITYIIIIVGPTESDNTATIICQTSSLILFSTYSSDIRDQINSRSSGIKTSKNPVINVIFSNKKDVFIRSVLEFTSE